jgi:17beta-estradiol 17-dehydrogenase/3beta-hydroxysteroid 3-dehydrogenase/mitotic-spindle organizing protein 1
MTIFLQRFGDFRKIETCLATVRDPFSIGIDSVLTELQLEIIGLQCDTDLRELHRREDISKFYNALNSDKFDQLKDYARKMFVVFGSTYICEQTFSIMNLNKKSLRSNISDAHLSSFENINNKINT